MVPAAARAVDAAGRARHARGASSWRSSRVRYAVDLGSADAVARCCCSQSFGGGLAWMLSLATVDGWGGLGAILDTQYEYLRTARAVTDIGALLRDYIAHIPLDSVDNWPVHIAGHPPGALLFFVLLVRLGLGSGLAAGLVVTVIAATTPVAVLLTLRRLGAEPGARKRGAVPRPRAGGDLDVGVGRRRVRRRRRMGPVRSGLRGHRSRGHPRWQRGRSSRASSSATA